MTFEETVKSKNVLSEIVNEIQLIKKSSEIYRILLENLSDKKKETNLAEFQHTESLVERTFYMDRIYPVPTVVINDFNRKTGTNIDGAKMIYGPASDEIARSNHALAIAVADTIFFRNGAYKPETEEGRKLLAHELTHVAQNKNKEKYRNVQKEELENEAEETENIEKNEKDPLIIRRIGNKTYSLKESVWEKIREKAKKETEHRIMRAEYMLSDREYLELLIKYKEKTERNGWEWHNLQS